MRNEYERITLEHNVNKMKINSKLAQLQQIREKLVLKNDNAEEVLTRDGDKLRAKVMDLSNINWGIDNIAEKCLKLKYGNSNKPVEAFTLDEKLEAVTVMIAPVFTKFLFYGSFLDNGQWAIFIFSWTSWKTAGKL
jgi:hypothetical protein